jgi:uncharacterized damage-inducible protein DinB
MDFRSVSEVYEHIDHTRARLLAAVEGLSEEQQSFSPAPDRWSVAQLCEHLSIVEGNVATLLDKLLAKAEESGTGGATSGAFEPISIEEFVERSRVVKFEAPERIRPTGAHTVADTLPPLSE